VHGNAHGGDGGDGASHERAAAGLRAGLAGKRRAGLAEREAGRPDDHARLVACGYARDGYGGMVAGQGSGASGTTTNHWCKAGGCIPRQRSAWRVPDALSR
jgi:hypothetical protein